jgi:hypothetical protein
MSDPRPSQLSELAARQRFQGAEYKDRPIASLTGPQLRDFVFRKTAEPAESKSRMEEQWMGLRNTRVDRCPEGTLPVVVEKDNHAMRRLLQSFSVLQQGETTADSAKATYCLDDRARGVYTDRPRDTIGRMTHEALRESRDDFVKLRTQMRSGRFQPRGSYGEDPHAFSADDKKSFANDLYGYLQSLRDGYVDVNGAHLQAKLQRIRERTAMNEARMLRSFFDEERPKPREESLLQGGKRDEVPSVLGDRSLRSEVWDGDDSDTGSLGSVDVDTDDEDVQFKRNLTRSLLRSRTRPVYSRRSAAAALIRSRKSGAIRERAEHTKGILEIAKMFAPNLEGFAASQPAFTTSELTAREMVFVRMINVYLIAQRVSLLMLLEMQRRLKNSGIPTLLIPHQMINTLYDHMLATDPSTSPVYREWMPRRNHLRIIQVVRGFDNQFDLQAREVELVRGQTELGVAGQEGALLSDAARFSGAGAEVPTKVAIDRLLVYQPQFKVRIQMPVTGTTRVDVEELARNMDFRYGIGVMEPRVILKALVQGRAIADMADSAVWQKSMQTALRTARMLNIDMPAQLGPESSLTAADLAALLHEHYMFTPDSLILSEDRNTRMGMVLWQHKLVRAIEEQPKQGARMQVETDPAMRSLSKSIMRSNLSAHVV